VSSRGRTFGSAMAAYSQGQSVKVVEPTKVEPEVAVNDPNFVPAGAGVDLDKGKPKASDALPTSGGIPFTPLQEAPAASQPSPIAPASLARPIGMDDPATAAGVAKATKPQASEAVYRLSEEQRINSSVGEQLQRQTLQRNVEKVQTGQIEIFQSIAGSVSSVDAKMTTLIDEVRKLQLVGGSESKPQQNTAQAKRREIPVDNRPLPVKMG